MANKPIYLDYNATTPLHEEVVKTMMPFLTEHFGNPSSSHIYGKTTKKAIEKAREQVANMLFCSSEEIVFTSGGSESNNYAIKGIAYAKKNQGNHIITSKIEHPSVIEVCKYLETQGFQVTYVNVDKYGVVNVEELKRSITEKTILVTIMHANNEVGTIQPLKEISKICREKKIVFHTDASQSIGKIPTRVDELGVDLLTVCAHKFYAPKGVGALYIRKGITLEKQIHGASHENGLRAGTENVLLIAGLGKACELVRLGLQKRAEHMKHTRDLLWDILQSEFSGYIELNGHPEDRLPNTLSVSFPHIPAHELLAKIRSKVACSAGAACHCNEITLSSVLKAMGVPIERGLGTLRLSTGILLTDEQVKEAAKVIIDAVRELKDFYQV